MVNEKQITWDKIPIDAVFTLAKELGVVLSPNEFAILCFCIKYSNYSEAKGHSYFRLNQSYISRQTGWERTKIVRAVDKLIGNGFIKDVTPKDDAGKVRIYTLNDKLKV